jgi:LPXTG-motif cell wall-anchored protein
MAYSLRAIPDATSPSYSPAAPTMPQVAMRMALTGAPAAHVPTVSLGVRTATPAQIMIIAGLVLLMLSGGLWWGVRRRSA